MVDITRMIEESYSKSNQKSKTDLISPPIEEMI
jgi:hypothetical protein